ncbi:hypothetical protein ACE1OC_38375 [Streptomyces sp. DSM 116496]|uniref:hypothetical protein n=1 Tax=Streptomyces stoeckheimensis TaxID=3344656 RepID=UPI0038B329FB
MAPDGSRQVGRGERQLHGDAVAAIAQLGVDPLGETVEGARDEQDVHGDSLRRTGATAPGCPAGSAVRAGA